MKFLITLLCLGCLSVSSLNAGNVTARQGLATVDRSTQVRIGPKVVSIMGVQGQDQPASWLYIIQNARGECFEFNVTNGRYLGSRGIPTVPVGRPIPPKRWRIDSSQAFLIAEKLACNERVGFDSVNYHLRCVELSDRAVWFLTLLDARSKVVGMVTLSADNGAVLAKSFPGAAVAQQPVPRSQPPAPPRQPGQTEYYTPRSQPSASPQYNPPPYYDAPQTQPAGVGDSLKEGVSKIGETLKGWINGLRGQPQVPEPVPYNYGSPVR